MKYYNFFKYKPIYFLMLIFICLSIIHIIFATMVERGFVFDGALWMPKILDQLSDKGWGFEPVFWRTRSFIHIVNQLPLNIAYHLGVHSKISLCRLFSLPLFLFPFLVTLWNIYLAKRTKRYDIALLGLFVYGVLVLPAIIYAIFEAYLASTLIVLFYHYLVSDIKFNKTDISIISFISIILLYSTELMIFIGPILYSYVLIVTLRKKQSKEKIIKILMGLFAAAACIIQLFFNYVFILLSVVGKNDFDRDMGELFNSFCYFRNIFNQPIIIEFVLFLLIIFAFIYKKKIGLLGFINMCILYTAALIYSAYNTNFSLYSWDYISYRLYIIVFMPIILFFVCLQDIFKKYLPKQKIYNLFIFILTAAIINTSIQLLYSNNVLKLQTRLNEIVSESPKTFLKTYEDLIEIYYDKNNNYFGTFYPSADLLLHNNSYKINKIILPDLSTWSHIDLFKTLEFHPEKNIFYLNFYKLHIKNKFWDLSDIAAEFNKNPQYVEDYKLKDPDWIHNY